MGYLVGRRAIAAVDLKEGRADGHVVVREHLAQADNVDLDVDVVHLRRDVVERHLGELVVSNQLEGAEHLAANVLLAVKPDRLPRRPFGHELVDAEQGKLKLADKLIAANRLARLFVIHAHENL